MPCNTQASQADLAAGNLEAARGPFISRVLRKGSAAAFGPFMVFRHAPENQRKWVAACRSYQPSPLAPDARNLSKVAGEAWGKLSPAEREPYIVEAAKRGKENAGVLLGEGSALLVVKGGHLHVSRVA